MSHNLNLTVETFPGTATTPHMLHQEGGNISVSFDFVKQGPKPHPLTHDSVVRCEEPVVIKRDSEISEVEEAPKLQHLTVSSLAKAPPISIQLSAYPAAVNTQDTSSPGLFQRKGLPLETITSGRSSPNRDSIMTNPESIPEDISRRTSRSTSQQPPSSNVDLDALSCKNIFQAICCCCCASRKYRK